MRRTIFLALLAALLIAPAARATPPIEIQRDCVDDGALQGSYSASDLRKARDSLPTDADEYSDCRDLLSRAIADKTASSGNGGASNGGGGGGTSGGGSDTSPDTGSSAPESTATPSATPRPAIPPGPPTEADTQALAQALNHGPTPVEVGGKAVSPGQSRLAASVGRNSAPGSLFAVFGLLVVAGLLAMGVPFIRRRVNARHQA
jgi:hypothetical protein